jgi:hypothetical protein
VRRASRPANAAAPRSGRTLLGRTRSVAGREAPMTDAARGALLVLGGGGWADQRRAGRRTAAGGRSAHPRTRRLGEPETRWEKDRRRWLLCSAWEEDNAGRRTGLGFGGGASHRRWVAGGAQEAGPAREALAVVLPVRLLLGPVDGEMRKRIGCGWGSSGPRAASTVFSGMGSTELTSEARFELRIPARLSARFHMRSALPR